MRIERIARKASAQIAMCHLEEALLQCLPVMNALQEQALQPNGAACLVKHEQLAVREDHFGAVVLDGAPCAKVLGQLNARLPRIRKLDAEHAAEVELPSPGCFLNVSCAQNTPQAPTPPKEASEQAAGK